MTYTLEEGGGVFYNGRFIPENAANREWRIYEAWRAAGNTPDPIATLPLEDERAAAKEAADAQAKALIEEKLPAGADAYVLALEDAEAAAAIADASPLQEVDYPLLAALIGPLGVDLDEVAAAVQARRDSIAARVAALHTTRSQVYAAVDAAADVAAVRAAVANIAWPAEPQPV
ncbi:MAG: hypothetical protein AAGG01_12225 [Planctomycetota bacterium]